MQLRVIFTGPPGAGKTSLLTELADSGGVDVVGEAATAVIAEQQALGVPEPWTDEAFCDRIAARQRAHQLLADQRGAPVVLFDRSPICTLALTEWSSRPVGRTLQAELDRVARERVYAAEVFYVEPLGWVQRTAARRITYPDSLRFGELHRRAYESLGHRLIDVPALPLQERTAWARAAITRLARG